MLDNVQWKVCKTVQLMENNTKKRYIVLEQTKVKQINVHIFVIGTENQIAQT